MAEMSLKETVDSLIGILSEINIVAQNNHPPSNQFATWVENRTEVALKRFSPSRQIRHQDSHNTNLQNPTHTHKTKPHTP